MNDIIITIIESYKSIREYFDVELYNCCNHLKQQQAMKMTTVHARLMVGP